MPKFTVYLTAEVDEVYEVEADDGDTALSAAEGKFEEEHGSKMGWTSIQAREWEYSAGNDGMDDGI